MIIKHRLPVLYIVVFVLALMQSCTKSGSGDVSGNNGVSGTTVKATVTLPNTMFLSSADYSTSGIGSYWVQQFTLGQSTDLIMRFASAYQAQAAIITPDQLTKFESNQTFSGYGLFDKTFGTTPITMPAGTYYLAVRNFVAGANKWSIEVDYNTTLPATDKATFVDDYLTGVKAFTTASKFWQPFTIQTGYRYFLDGDNVNCDLKIIPATELSNYQNGLTYKYFTDYADATGAGPGLWEVTLPAGDYYLVSTNTTTAALTYTMERWRLN